jgi:universal protein Kae1
MIVLGIESTAHTLGISIMKDKKVLANVSDTYKTEKGGIIPTEAAKHHIAAKEELILRALDNAKVKLIDVDLIAYSKSPGLAPCLRVGTMIAKELSEKLNIPTIGVNHCIAHLEIGNLMTGAKDPVLLYASGANTQIIAYAAGKYRIFGETLDLGVGNFIDTFARTAGMGFPGGPKIAELAKQVTCKSFAQSPKLIELPYSVKGMDVSFSGMLTNLQQKLKNHSLAELSYSLQETAFAMLLEVSERAMAHLGKKELLLGGGVACNSRLQEMAKKMCSERNARFFCPERQFLVDNAAMIAWLGQLMYKSGIRQKEIDFDPNERTDMVDVKWR